MTYALIIIMAIPKCPMVPVDRAIATIKSIYYDLEIAIRIPEVVNSVYTKPPVTTVNDVGLGTLENHQMKCAEVFCTCLHEKLMLYQLLQFYRMRLLYFG